MAKKLNVKTDDLQEKLAGHSSNVSSITNVKQENFKKRMGFYLDDELIAWLKDSAKKKHCSVNNIIVQLILEAREKEV